MMAGITTLFSHVASGRLVKIVAAAYDQASFPSAYGVVVPKKRVEVKNDFFTPPAQMTNQDVNRLCQKFAEHRFGWFVKDTKKEAYFLYATGSGEERESLRLLDPKYLPPDLQIELLEEALRNPDQNERFQFCPQPKKILPSPSRYDGLNASPTIQYRTVSATVLTYWEAQALAQFAVDLFDLGSEYYSNLLSNEEWGLMAMESSLEYMTQTGKLWDTVRKKLRAFGFMGIVNSNKYPSLPNGILPNTVSDLTRTITDFLHGPAPQGLNPFHLKTRGGGWGHDERHAQYLRVSHQDVEFYEQPSFGLGFRIGIFPRVNESVGS